MPPVDGTTGWIYQPQTQQIIANVMGNDSSGTPYASY
jgi:outer membrane lipoprotein-sorting protein